MLKKGVDDVVRNLLFLRAPLPVSSPIVNDIYERVNRLLVLSTVRGDVAAASLVSVLTAPPVVAEGVVPEPFVFPIAGDTMLAPLSLTRALLTVLLPPQRSLPTPRPRATDGAFESLLLHLRLPFLLLLLLYSLEFIFPRLLRHTVAAAELVVTVV